MKRSIIRDLMLLLAIFVATWVAVYINSQLEYKPEVLADTPPTKTITELDDATKQAIVELAFAIEIQGAVCRDAPVQAAWFRKHLEKTVAALEEKYNLEPMPIETPLGPKQTDYQSVPFVEPYVQPKGSVSGEQDVDTLHTRIELLRLAAKIKLRATNANMINPSIRTSIDNLSKRLERLEPLLKSEQEH